MADSLLIRSLNARILNLSNKKLEKVPRIIGKLSRVIEIDLKSNFLKELPEEFAKLVQVESLNLGNNEFKDLPPELQSCLCLRKLHIFGNYIVELSPKVLGYFWNLTLLNVNSNRLRNIPPEIGSLSCLRCLSLDNNELQQLPVELCTLSLLEELHVANNRLTSLPLALGCLRKLQRLHAQKNKIKDLPESISACIQLAVLDVAANDIHVLPTQFGKLPLKEFYCEENPLIENVPVQSVQEDEVLTLKEITARFIMKELKNRECDIRKAIPQYPSICEMLSQSSKCALCHESFLNTWLECVQFVNIQKDKTPLSSTPRGAGLPVRALLCSYSCFNSPGHSYFGVAFP